MTLKTYLSYFKMGAGLFGALLNCLLFILSQFIILSADYWINNWASIEEKNTHSNKNNSMNFTINYNQTCHANVITNRLFYYKIYSCKIF